MMRNRCARVLILTILVLSTLTPGCALRDEPPMTVYALEPRWSAEERGAAAAKNDSRVLQVAPVRGAIALQATDILYADQARSQQSYAHSRWREAPVRAMQTVIEVALGNSGLFKAVLPSNSEAGADLVLEGTLLECGHVLKEGGASQGVVRMRFYLIDTKDRTVIANKELVAIAPAATNDASGATAAINQAALQVAADLAAWLAGM
jgi:ABC-type uncharacterized transport system auxiliary subunit